jgi:hypothetical protein
MCMVNWHTYSTFTYKTSIWFYCDWEIRTLLNKGGIPQKTQSLLCTRLLTILYDDALPTHWIMRTTGSFLPFVITIFSGSSYSSSPPWWRQTRLSGFKSFSGEILRTIIMSLSRHITQDDAPHQSSFRRRGWYYAVLYAFPVGRKWQEIIRPRVSFWGILVRI